MPSKVHFANELKGKEIVHYADDNRLISSWHNKIYINRGEEERLVVIPNKSPEKLLGVSRLARRLLRLDKCNVFPVGDDLVVIRRGYVYHYDWQTDRLSQVLKLRNCNNVLHQSVSISPGGNIYFGEYGSNKERRAVPVYKSADGGKSWQVVYEFVAGKVKHVHGCYWDEVEKRVWVCTGDFENENWILSADENFKDVEWVGDGSQKYRACNFFFENDSIHWIMDSHLEPSYHYSLDRKTRKIERLQMFRGPVWYIKRLDDGYYLAGTTQEKGAGVLDKHAHLMLSKDLKNWEDIYQFSHDGYSRKYFKNGIISFADGKQTSKKFYMFFEALKGFDGKSFECSLHDGNEKKG